MWIVYYVYSHISSYGKFTLNDFNPDVQVIEFTNRSGCDRGQNNVQLTWDQHLPIIICEPGNGASNRLPSKSLMPRRCNPRQIARMINIWSCCATRRDAKCHDEPQPMTANHGLRSQEEKNIQTLC